MKKHDKGVIHVKAQPFGELALGLLDDDPAVQGCLELLGQRFAEANVTLNKIRPARYAGRSSDANSENPANPIAAG